MDTEATTVYVESVADSFADKSNNHIEEEEVESTSEDLLNDTFTSALTTEISALSTSSFDEKNHSNDKNDADMIEEIYKKIMRFIKQFVNE